MSEPLYKDLVLQVHPEARIAAITTRGMTLYVVRAGREGRYLGELHAEPKAAWQSAWQGLPKGKLGDGTGQMGLGLIDWGVM